MKPARTPATAAPFKTTSAGLNSLSDPKLFLNRELTWLNFNWRVLHEAADDRTPLLERLKYAAIVSSNLDEFFMKRIGGLKQQVGAGLHELTVDGRTPQQQILNCYKEVLAIEARKLEIWVELQKRLRRHSIRIVRYGDLEASEQELVRSHYLTEIFPLVTPQAMDPAHPFPFVSNLSLNLLVGLRAHADSPPLTARVKVPVDATIPRFLQVGRRRTFVPIEEVVSNNLDLLFPDMLIESCSVFRVTRNAVTETDEEKADDLLAMIEGELRDRKFAPIVRLQVDEQMSAFNRGKLAAELGLDEGADVFETSGMLGMRDLWEIANLDLPKLRYPDHRPIDHTELTPDRNIFHVIRERGAVLLHHPYDSFTTSVERFLSEASVDPKVKAIKMTLYRTSSDSRIVDTLIEAARNGKQVAVAVELKARFDEERNMRWASQLEEVGIHVSYGVVGLKTHCKVILVVRQDYSGLRRYAHFGTGNYHSGTARLYSDLGLLTCDEDIGHDLTELFNYLTTGYNVRRSFRKILPAPTLLKDALLDKIEREIDHQAEGQDGHIQIKTNALEDADVTRALYRASAAGVQVDLIVRDTCRLRPGLPELSHNIRVISIVGRFLEHARILYFRNAGDEEYYIGSADCMQRNLESRIETVVPVEHAPGRKELRRILDVQISDSRFAWEMRPDGSYQQRRPDSDSEGQGSHHDFIEWSQRLIRKARRSRRKSKLASKAPEHLKLKGVKSV